MAAQNECSGELSKQPLRAALKRKAGSFFDDDEILSEIHFPDDYWDGSIAKSPGATAEPHENEIEDGHQSYYLQDFQLAIDSVLSNQEDAMLFNEDDNIFITSFTKLTQTTKELYLRLYNRKLQWFPRSKITYPKISDNLQPYIEELVNVGFLQTETALHNLGVVLDLLTEREVQNFAKSLHVTLVKGKNKRKLVTALLNYGSQQSSLFAGESVQKNILKQAKKIVGPCVKLTSEARKVFARIVWLLTMNLVPHDHNLSRNELTILFLASSGKAVYPKYEVSRKMIIFQEREDLILCISAYEDFCQLQIFCEKKQFEEAEKIYLKVHRQFKEAMENLAKGDPRLSYSSKLPIHLRRFTSTWFCTKVCSQGVELLQRNKQYQQAVDLLRELMQQQDFCPHYRGRWYERLVMNLEHHLKKPVEAFDAILHGLTDDHVNAGHRLFLQQRAKKLTQQNAGLVKLDFPSLRQPKAVTIYRKQMANCPTFLIDGGVKIYCGVEELAQNYYKMKGYNETIHGESAPFTTIYCLLMWDVIFSTHVPDVFRTSFQDAPLDFFFESFYLNRKEIIEKRLAEIRDYSVQELAACVKETWQAHNEERCAGVNWKIFSGVAHIMELVQCIGSQVLAEICERFAKGFRHLRAGMPDLVVWSSTTLKYKMVEVKGPTDRLSTQQQVWLDVLAQLGVETEVLYVKAGLPKD